MKRFYLLLTLVLAAVTLTAASPKRELRSVWLTTYSHIDWPNSSSAGNPDKCKQELIEYLDKHQNRNFNGVCLHVRCWADAVYKSSYEPWSEFVSGERGLDPGWDPLEFAVEECHKRGLECYAWINPFRFNRHNNSRTTPQDEYVLSQPGWIIDNGTTTSHDEYQVFNPALKDVREYLLKIIREIYTNYRIDGMLFDDYFYPNGIPANSTAQDFVYFQEQNPGLSATKQHIGDWRRANINLFMRELYDMIQQDRPDLRFGLSPAGVAKEGCKDIDGLNPVNFGTDWQYDDIYSDPVAWLNDRSIDFISPQLYWFSRPGNNSYTSAAPYTPLCQWWSNTAHFFGRHFYSSMAPYRFCDGDGRPVYNNEDHWEDMSHQIDLNRNYNLDNAPGAIMYSAKYMDGPKCDGWGAYLQANSFQNKSLVPLITWKERPELVKPQNLAFDGKILRWPGGQSEPTGYDPIRRYTVYAIPAYVNLEQAMAADGDGIDVQYLMQVVYGEEYTVPSRKREGHWFAVCAYDGYGYESEPATVNEGVPPVPVDRDETVYPEAGGLNVTNMWFRSTLEPFENIEFGQDGKLNRGMVIAGDKVLLCGRKENAAGPCYLYAYALESGYFQGEIELDIDDTYKYPCNDIFRDNAGDIYITTLSTNIASPNNPLAIYRFDPVTNSCALWTVLTASDAVRSRVDHCAVERLADGTYYVYAAVASGKKLIRWTVGADGTVADTQLRDITEFEPATARNFGLAPRVVSVGNGKIIVDGGNTYPAEYDFATGALTGRFGEALAPAGTECNGVAHFGPAECLMAYAAADHESATGYKFNVTSADSHDIASHSLLWQLPAINFGNVNSTTCSTPVDAVTDGNADAWTAHVAIYVPGNGLAVYEVTKGNTGISAPESAMPDYTVIGGRVFFSRIVESVAVYDLSGRCLNDAVNTTSVGLPQDAGVYFVRYGNKAARIAVR